MIGPTVREMLLENQETPLIPAGNMANATYHHPLSHGLPVLSKIGYSKVPVLGKDDHFVGLVSLSDMINKIIDLQTVSTDLLGGLAVADVTETDVPTIDENWELGEVLHSLVGSPFLPVVTGDRIFKGIVTGKGLLRAINFIVYELERRSILSPEIEELKEQADIVS